MFRADYKIWSFITLDTYAIRFVKLVNITARNNDKRDGSVETT